MKSEHSLEKTSLPQRSHNMKEPARDSQTQIVAARGDGHVHFEVRSEGNGVGPVYEGVGRPKSIARLVRIGSSVEAYWG